MEVVTVLGGQAVLDAGDRLGAVPGPHLLDAQGEHGAVLDARRHGRQVQRGAPPGARVVDVDDGHLAEPGLAEPGLPRMQPWSLSRPAMALPTMISPSSCGAMPASSSASWATS